MRKILAAMVVVGVIFGLAVSANSTQAGGNLQTVPTRGPSPTARVATNEPTLANPTAVQAAPTQTAAQPAATVEPTVVPSTATAGPTLSPSSTEAAGVTSQAAPAGLNTPTASAGLTRASDTPAPPSSLSANTVSPAGTGQPGDQPASGSGSSGWFLVAGPFILLALVIIYVNLRRRRKARQKKL